MVPGVVHVEIDAEHHLDLVRRLGVMRTPTTFVLDAAGAITTRASGQPRKADVIAALGRIVEWRQSSHYLVRRSSTRSIFTYARRMESTYLTKRRAVDNCHTATALCRMP